MKERPILFTSPMVRAVLDDSKTQTRRIASKPVRHPDLGNLYAPGALVLEREPQHVIERACPYGRPGDLLWVRETCRADELPDGQDGVRYLADDHFEPIKATEDAADQWVTMHHYRGGSGGGMIGPTVPAIHMPRWASRILLEVTSVSVERLQDISRGDAMAEGCPFPNMANATSPRDWYAALWEQINGGGSWDANPWVWVIGFKRIKGDDIDLTTTADEPLETKT
jgi:hypothetical protein